MDSTYMARPGQVDRKWFVVDAAGIPLGRLASAVAHVLRGKHKPIYTPHVDTGDHVIVVNADKIELTGNKLDDKQYIRHSHYPGGLRTMSYREFLARTPDREHPHQAQQPEPLDLDRFI